MLFRSLQMADTVKQGSIFNVDEPTGAQQAAHQTTAAEARIEAETPQVAREVDANAEQTRGAAEQAAQAAQGMGTEFTGGSGRGPLDSLAGGMSQKTNAATEQGKRDVEHAKASGATYIDQAKSMAGDMYNSAQNFVQGGQSKGTDTDAPLSANTSSAFATLQATGAAAIGTTQQYLASAQAVVQPHVANAQAAAQPYIDRAKETAQGYLGMSGAGGVEGRPEGRPTTNEPVEGTTPNNAVPMTTTVEGVDPRAKPPTTVA